MKREQIFLFLVMLLSILGCKEKEPETYYVDQEMLKYCWFPEGSYWIYGEDSVNGLTDSVFVEYRENSILPDEGEGYQIEQYSSNLRVFGHLVSQMMRAVPSADNATVTFLEEMDRTTGSTQTDILLFSDTGGSNTFGADFNSFERETLDSLVLVSGVFYHVVRAISSHPQNAFMTTEAYWCRDIGLIRRKLKDGTSWSLLRYHIQ